MTTTDPAARDEIVIYGASGYTGKLIAAELASRGMPLILAGRNEAKLEAVAAGLGPGAEARVAAVPVDDTAGLRELLGPVRVVVACAGPFTLHGAPVIEAAARTGTHYLDTTGEQPFIRDSFDRWGPIAADSGAALVSGFGFDYVPGDMLAALDRRGTRADRGDDDRLQRPRARRDPRHRPLGARDDQGRRRRMAWGSPPAGIDARRAR